MLSNQDVTASVPSISVSSNESSNVIVLGTQPIKEHDDTHLERQMTRTVIFNEKHHDRIKTMSIWTLLRSIGHHVIVGIGVTFLWRAMWHSLDYGVDLDDKESKLQSVLISIAISVIIPLSVAIIQWIHSLHCKSGGGRLSRNGSSVGIKGFLSESGAKSKILQYVLILLFAISNVAFWRGFWYLMDLTIFPNNELVSIATSAVAGFIILGLLQNVSSILSVPLAAPLSDKDGEIQKKDLARPSIALQSVYQHHRFSRSQQEILKSVTVRG